MTTQPPARDVDTDIDALSRADRTEKLADQLSRLYDLRSMEVLKAEEPDRAQEHHDAACGLRGWLRGLPKAEEKEVFQRGWDRAMRRAGRRVAELEAAIASRPGGLPAPSIEWHLARQDPRYAIVRREILALDTVAGEMALPSPLQELLALRLISALKASDLAEGEP
ncbi:hypothetical protein [Streptomyces sp. NPDC091027]|uniref:hypothetical protein n=1 Tax=Streptomyces sp. NPDC091027 TaxID=3365971 RepID=UPI003810F596